MFEFGNAASPHDATRTVEIDAIDIAFVPTHVDVQRGETVLFRIHNRGEAVHDFTIGDSATQDAHEAEMAESKDPAMGHGDANAVIIQPGKTAELAFTFTSPGELIFGCHVPGHYAAGMRGTITVSG